jgi:hypothetical protein
MLFTKTRRSGDNFCFPAVRESFILNWGISAFAAAGISFLVVAVLPKKKSTNTSIAPSPAKMILLFKIDS